MPTPSLGLVGAGGAKAFSDSLFNLVRQRKEEALIAQKRAFDEEQARIRAAQVERELGQRDRGLDIDEYQAVARATAPGDPIKLPGMRGPGGTPRTILLNPRTMEIEFESDEWVKPDDADKPQVLHGLRGTRGQPVTRAVDRTGKPIYEFDEVPPQPRVEPIVAVVTPDGPRYVRQGEAVGQPPASAQRPVTGTERQTLNFYNRLKGAMETMKGIEDQLDERDLLVIHNSPLPELLNNRLLSPTGRQYVQALREYTEARLRKESGAAIPESEFANDRRMIARASGDDPTTIEQKRTTRERTAEGFAVSAGRAYEDFYGEPYTPRARQQQPGGGAGPRVGERRVDPQGRQIEWDGRGWKLVGG